MFFTHLPKRKLSVPAREIHHLCWILTDLRLRGQVQAEQFRQLFDQVVLPFLAVQFPSSTTVVGGKVHTCAVKADGQLVCFGLGHNDYGQCDVPTDLGPVRAVAAGWHHTCAVKADGQLVCFGDNSYGHCNVPTDLGPVVSVAAGACHTCAVKPDGQLVCFGYNSNGECNVPTDMGPVVAVAGGAYHTCAVKADGQLVCFGDNGYGQCDVPTDLGPVRAVAAGWHHTCAVKADGQLVCFGDNSYRHCNVPTDMGPVVAVAGGAYHTCAVKLDGQLVCFGHNDYGQCDVPTDLGPVVTVAAGWHHTCAVKADGQLACFGHNYFGQCDVPTDLGPVLLAEVVESPGIQPIHGTAESAASASSSDVVQVVQHAEAAAEILPEEAAAIVAEQEASLIERNIHSGWHSHASQTASMAGGHFCRVVLLQLSRTPRELNGVLEQSKALQATRQALADEGYHWHLPNGAKAWPYILRSLQFQSNPRQALSPQSLGRRDGVESVPELGGFPGSAALPLAAQPHQDRIEVPSHPSDSGPLVPQGLRREGRRCQQREFLWLWCVNLFSAPSSHTISSLI